MMRCCPLFAHCLLLAILLLALLVRLFLTPHPGYSFDISLNQSWTQSATTLGISRSYREQVNGTMLPNYPPFSMILFATTGSLYQLLGGTFMPGSPLWHTIIKLPAILADLLICLVLFWVLTARYSPPWGLAGALLYALHPAAVYDSAVWGQTDALYTLFSLISLACCTRNRWLLSGFFLLLSIFTKLQAIQFLPLVFFLLLRSPRRFLSATIGGTLATAMVLLPLHSKGDLSMIGTVYSALIDFYPKLTNSAYNFWWMLFGDQANTTASTAPLFQLISYRWAGLLLVSTFYAFFLWILRKPLLAKDCSHKHTVTAIFLCASGMSFAFFLFNAQMHERYLFPFIVIALPIACIAPRFTWIYSGVSLLFFLNLLGVLPTIRLVRILYETFPAFDGAIASGLVFLFSILAYSTWKYAR